MNCCRETVEMLLPPSNRRELDIQQYVARSDSLGRLEGRPYPWSQSAAGGIRETSGLVFCQWVQSLWQPDGVGFRPKRV